MRRSFISQAARAAFIVATAVAGVALVAGEAVAWHTVAHSGVNGHYSFVDTSASPGARCDYEGAAGHGYFNNMRVKPPTVFWPNQDSGNPDEHGTVGWKFKIQHWNGVKWTTANISTESTAVAHENTSAAFFAKHVQHGPPDNHRYRAQVVLTWYTPAMAVLGQAKVVLDWYNQTDPGVTVTSCKGVVCHVCGPVPGGTRASDVARHRLEALPLRRN
jgi:hypothetical protein